ncbi:signal recognition particle-docking protein FtsY [Methylocella silvestris BL2]|uniref:Signal recognition particle receptor FtsY n=1 Tax=Methylocella silvestris (strain DSM 15510 / CIP 108128 / LMG 27833 / NCIMB 13906 / BL2) TaxID=395965 RepID=B8EQB7_METSB|nr:signal recognition particle-docking protein FtsY [Methylocella silvestris]ACK52130.1 signal recognition particle-docking protein FtsY [Methylocella silvestris BL2]
MEHEDKREGASGAKISNLFSRVFGGRKDESIVEPEPAAPPQPPSGPEAPASPPGVEAAAEDLASIGPGGGEPKPSLSAAASSADLWARLSAPTPPPRQSLALEPAPSAAVDEPQAGLAVDAPEPAAPKWWERLLPPLGAEGAAPPVVETAPAPQQPAIAEPPADLAAPESAPKGWWTRLRQGLARSSDSIGSGLKAIFTKRKLDAAMLDELEEVLIRADLGVATATHIAGLVGKGRYDKSIEVDEVKTILAEEVERVLAPYARPLEIDPAIKPFVILVVGVNGSGKTTTIGKLAAQFSQEGRKVLLAAGDTFRAAAIEQLRLWGDRLNCAVIAGNQGSDASALAFDAIRAARESGADILIMDTAGRLQNRAELMAELEKIVRVMKKVEPAAPHAVLLVLDATVGQNAVSQTEIFSKVAGVTGLVMTKLDGTARGGILVALAEKFQLPIHYVGVGETAADLAPFAARDFARAIAGLDETDAPRH